MKKLIFGCVADDFTGASDAASFIAKAGMRTILFDHVPKKPIDYDIDAAVIALKSRTDEKRKAIKDSTEAARWLESQGAEHIYSKYCSTFDSTPEGNIGPVMDALLEYFDEEFTILCPALPVNGRIVKEGKLYVNGVLLEESSMRNHPLTPMRESHIGKLMEQQSDYPCLMLNEEWMKHTKEEIWSYIMREKGDKKRCYLVPDYITDEDSKKISEVFGKLKILSGGSGILTNLCKSYLSKNTIHSRPDSKVQGKGIVFAGSCSVATLEQIDTFCKTGQYTYKIHPHLLETGEENADTIWEEVQRQCDDKEILIYSSDRPDKVREAQRRGKEATAIRIENTFSSLAAKAVKCGYKRIIVAGGETSGAVTKALNYDAFYIGESIAPGVPVMIPVHNSEIRLVLKSGNFGASDFFIKALEKTAKENKSGQGT